MHIGTAKDVLLLDLSDPWFAGKTIDNAMSIFKEQTQREIIDILKDSKIKPNNYEYGIIVQPCTDAQVSEKTAHDEHLDKYVWAKGDSTNPKVIEAAKAFMEDESYLYDESNFIGKVTVED